jgi:putative ABC transport system permease protein
MGLEELHDPPRRPDGVDVPAGMEDRLDRRVPRGTVLRLVVGQGTALAALGVAAGLTASLAVSRLLASQLFGVAPGDPAALAAAGMLLLLGALAASWVPAHRVDPVKAIRYE